MLLDELLIEKPTIFQPLNLPEIRRKVAPFTILAAEKLSGLIHT